MQGVQQLCTTSVLWKRLTHRQARQEGEMEGNMEDLEIEGNTAQRTREKNGEKDQDTTSRAWSVRRKTGGLVTEIGLERAHGWREIGCTGMSRRPNKISPRGPSKKSTQHLFVLLPRFTSSSSQYSQTAVLHVPLSCSGNSRSPADMGVPSFQASNAIIYLTYGAFL